MKIIERNVDELIPYENNPRINDQAVVKVAESIKEFGFKNPIIIDKDDVIVCGHTRLKACKKLGIEKVPTIVADDLTEEQIKAFRIAENKTAEYAEWDYEKLEQELKEIGEINMGAFDFELDAFEDQKPVFEDEIPQEEDIEPQVKKGDIWQLGEHRLMCGSSTDEGNVQELMHGEIADMCLTDPPYNVNLGQINKAKVRMSSEHYKGANTSDIENDSMDDNAFHDFLVAFYSNMKDVLKAGGVFYIFHAETEGLNFRSALHEVGLQTRQTLIWVKNCLSLGLSDYQWKHEPCLYGWKEGTHYFIDDRTQTTTIEDMIDLQKATKEELIDEIKKLWDQLSTTAIHENKPVRNDLHPTMKPINLCARLIRNSSKPKDIVYDGFGGSGSTLIACEQTGRKCYTMELDPHYCDVIIARWEALTGYSAIKIN